MKKKSDSSTILLEVAWEVCNQVGGIYTVIRSKVPSITEKWGENYCLVGPYLTGRMPAEFEPNENLQEDDFGKAVQKLRDQGIEAHYGYWLVTGKPKVVLINPFSVYYKLGEIKYDIWDNHKIPIGDYDELLNQVVAFGFVLGQYFEAVTQVKAAETRVLGHFHEWMTGLAVPEIRKKNLDCSLVFTTHATLLGRYLAMNSPNFYEILPYFDWEAECKRFMCESQVKIERAAAHGAQVLTTVSDVTARECLHLLGREVDVILPNGLNIQRFSVTHESQNLHGLYKDKIHEFVKGHFFQSYNFDLDKTLYFFTSGRFEYKNKGFDITLEAIARLNWKMQQFNIDKTVVLFMVTKQPFYSINPGALQSRALMEEMRDTCVSIEKKIGEKLFDTAASSQEYKFPDLNKFVDDYWKLRLRRTYQSWKTWTLPTIVTHNLVHEDKDEVLHFLRKSNLVNNKHDKVKVIYHPDFISTTNPLFKMEYNQFVRGCHLGVFPSYYEPWGYTPLESMASGVPAITSDLSGFGDYVIKNTEKYDEKGVYVVNRDHKSFDEAANQLAETMFSFVQMDRKERITQRYAAENASFEFDWSSLSYYYDKAYSLALQRI